MHIKFFTTILFFSFLMSICAASEKKLNPKVIFFDVNETLLDLNTMRPSVAKALDGRNDLLDLWFSTMLHYSLVSTAINDFKDFGQIGVAALMMVAEGHDIKLNAEEAKKAVVGPLLSIPAHPDVPDTLKVLSKKYVLVSFTNSSNKGVEIQLKNSGLIKFFNRRLSIEDIKIYKPQLKSYEWALKEMKIKPEEALMVAAHAWDVAGAKAAGMKTAFIARPGKVLYPLATKPDLVVPDLKALLEHLE